MEWLLLTMQVIALTSLSALCIYLIVVLVRVRSILSIVETDLKELSMAAIPILENLEVITERVKNVAEGIDQQVEIVKQSINAVKDIADNIVNFEQRIQQRIEEPVMDTVGIFVAIFKGVRTFLTQFRS